jgi:hypothetical protein
MVSIPTWLGAYAKAMDGQLENVRKGDERASIDYADSMVRQTQAAGAAKDNARIQRGTEAQKLFTMFYSSLSVLFNQFHKTAQTYRITKDLPQLIASLTCLWFAPALLEELIRGNAPDDDEDWLTWILTKELFYPTATLVGVRDVASMLERRVVRSRGGCAPRGARG